MTLTVTLGALCSRNVFVFKEHLIMLIATKYNDNITTNCEQITLNMRKLHVLSQFCVCMTLTLRR